jgi:aldose 1-epimerase
MAASNSQIKESPFGTLPDGRTAQLFTLRNSQGTVIRVTNYGLIITDIQTADSKGQLGTIVLGFDNLEQYLQKHPFFGAIAGRVANRIARGKFSLNGKEYSLAINNGPNHLHGGLKGFDKQLWEVTRVGSNALEFGYLSKDGEEGYPGNLRLKVTYTLGDNNELQIDYFAETDEPTPINVTNHSYFNLSGADTVREHRIRLNADHYTPVDDTLIPTGQIAPVQGTPFDFRQEKTIGQDLDKLKPQFPGYDHNFVLNGPAGSMKLAARVVEPGTGRTLEVHTTEPGMQFYSGNFLDGTLKGHGGKVYQQYAGFCLETQHFPDSINQPNFPNTVLKPGQPYRSQTIFRFGVL